MKKIFKITFVLLITLLLVSCSGFGNYKFSDGQFKEIYSPSVTQDEVSFIDMVSELSPSSVAITFLDSLLKPSRVSGVIIKKEESYLNSTYYVITALTPLINSTNIKVYTSPTNQYVGTLISNKTEVIEDEDIAVISFVSNAKLKPIPLKGYNKEYTSLISNTIFSIGTPVSNQYFNILTNPAAIMGVRDNIIIHGSNINFGQLGSPLYLKETGDLIGINIKYSTTINHTRPEVLINHAIIVNKIIELVSEVIEL